MLKCDGRVRGRGRGRSREKRVWMQLRILTENLYKLRIRESAQLKSVLELYDMEIHQKISAPNYKKLKTMVKSRKDLFDLMLSLSAVGEMLGRRMANVQCWSRTCGCVPSSVLKCWVVSLAPQLRQSPLFFLGEELGRTTVDGPLSWDRWAGGRDTLVCV